MIKPILLIQFRTDASVMHEQECIKKALGKRKLISINTLDENVIIPENLDGFAGLVTGGSGEYNISDWPKDIEAKIKRLKPLLSKAIELDFPVLAICFGHQLIAHWFGGEVKSDKAQAESGTCKIALNKFGMRQNLFKHIPQNFYAVLGHKDTVIKLPTGALLLADSKKCQVEAYKIKNNIYCVQFHPELDREGMLWRLSLYPSYADVEKRKTIEKKSHDIPYATRVLTNFFSRLK
jgi:GMP synthase (glutamine-hydrolysing)